MNAPDAIQEKAAPGIQQLWAMLKVLPGQARVWLALAQHYAAAGLTLQAAYTATQTARLDPSLAAAVSGLQPVDEATAPAAMFGRPVLRHADVWLAPLLAAVGREPGDWLSWLYLARLLEMPGAGTPAGAPDAARALQQALRLEPIAGESRHWMGVWRQRAGDADGAVQMLAPLVSLAATRHGSMMVLGEALLAQGRLRAAEAAFTRASGSQSPAFLRTLAARVFAQNYWEEALSLLKKALALEPDSLPTLLALARIQSEVYALADCRQTLQQIQALAPRHPEARLLAAGLRGRMGDAQGHLAELQAIHAAGDQPTSRLASSIAMTALYDDRASNTDLARLHASLCEPIERSVPERQHFANPPDTQRVLRIGFVTGDLHRQHPVNLFLLPLLQALDRRRLHTRVYYTGAMLDDYTRRARAQVDAWLDAAALSDAELQAAIVADGVDILIDLCGHTASHRLGVFALRAAPVQASFLGYPHSSGLTRMDWLIGDATVSPPEHAHLFTEGIAQLPGSVFCWAPVDDYPLPAPRAADAPLVFGSFNNAMKISPRTLALWAGVLQALPEARLLLKAPSLRDDGACTHFRERFGALGIAGERIEFRGPSGLEQMMQEYGDMDIALDTVPYNGGTTSLQALWMGVPLVTLMGDNFAGRMSASFLRSLGRADCVADSPQAFVQCAVRLAGRLDQIRAGRPALRTAMQASAVSDLSRYARHFEALLRAMWVSHVQTPGQRFLAVAPGVAVPAGRAP